MNTIMNAKRTTSDYYTSSATGKVFELKTCPKPAPERFRLYENSLASTRAQTVLRSENLPEAGKPRKGKNLSGSGAAHHL